MKRRYRQVAPAIRHLNYRGVDWVGMLSFWPNLFLFSLIVSVRYVVFAGVAYWICYRYNRTRWSHKKIVAEFPSREVVWAEFRGSLVTSVVFALAGALLVESYKAGGTKIYLDVKQYGSLYLLLQFPLLLILHDTYFYFLHRILHWPFFFRSVHRTHHASRKPTPWAAFSFHPIESVLEAVILPALVFFVPIHFGVFLFFLMFMTVSSVINHLGYELFPVGFARSPFFRHWITATHHHQHHHALTHNFGLYFTFWDRVLSTESPSYQAEYEKVTSRKPTLMQSVKSV